MDKVSLVLKKADRQISLQFGSDAPPANLQLQDLGTTAQLGQQAIFCQNQSTGNALLLVGLARLMPDTTLLSAEQLQQLLHVSVADYLPRLSGRFALFLIDLVNGAISVATDRFASLPLYYAEDDQQLVIANDLPLLQQYLHETDLSHQALLDYVYYHMIPSPHSIYQQVKKLPLASLLEYREVLTVNTYWQPDFTPVTKSKDALARELQQRLLDAVAPFSELAGSGCFLSGGLDSSTVTACLAKLSGQQIKTFTIGFAEPGYDETAYAKVVADAFNTEHHVYYVTADDIVDALPSLAAHFFEPFGNSSALPTYFCARYAKEQGISTLLAGDGGDELFSGNERYTKQLVFERYNRLPAWFRALVSTAVDAGNGLFNTGLLRKGKSFLQQSQLDLASRLQHYNFLHQHQVQDVFTADFLQQVNVTLPLSMVQQRFSDVATSDPVNSMLYNDWKFTLADNDLVKVNTMTSLAGVNVAYPLLDQGLLELANRIAPQLKLEGGQLRAFYKYACRDLLPKATLTKSKHGFGLPFGLWLSKHKPLQQLAYQQLCALKQRNLFRPQFIDNILQQHKDTHATYYGELIWLLTLLELWLNAHQPNWQMTINAIEAA